MSKSVFKAIAGRHLCRTELSFNEAIPKLRGSAKTRGMLKLRIENFDRLPDGGPLEHSANKRGFDFGRDSHLDWSLPDKSRVVSGKHCEVRFYDDAYWLIDVSTNGTFVNGSSKRVQSPYRLNEGDRLQIGEYIIAVTLDMPILRQEPNVAQEYSSPADQSRSSNIWDMGGAAPPPLNARDLMPKPAPAEVAPDYLNQALFVPPVGINEPIQKPQPAPASTWSTESVHAPQPVSVPLPVSAPSPQKTQDVKTDVWNFARRFAKGAGLPEDVFDKVDAAQLAETAGALLHMTVSHLMAMLQARAEAKAISRSGKRTMVRAAENNPLKFMPTAEEALQVMLMPRGESYLGAKQTLESTFTDLKLHHFALLAAMQAAANELLTELSPDAIKKSSDTKKSLLGSGKGKLWDDLVERWAIKGGKRENGMLEAFLDAFAEHYDSFSKRKS